MITFGQADQDYFLTSMRKIESELSIMRFGLEEAILENFNDLIDGIHVQQPTLDKNRQLVEIKTSMKLKTGKDLQIHQAIFLRNNEMLLIQMMLYKEDEGLLKYFHDILNDFDI